MKVALLCLVVLALVGLSLANESLDQHLRGDFRKSNAISAISYGNIHHIFARGLDSKIYYNKFNSSSLWEGWLKLGDNTFISNPAVASWSNGRLDVFAIDASNRLRTSFFNGVWNIVWTDLGGDYLPTVRALSSNVGQISVFVLDLGQKGVVFNYFGGWTTTSLGSLAVDDTIVPISWGTNRIDAFSLAAGKFVQTLTTNGGSSWSAWSTNSASTAPRFFGVPAVTAWAVNRLDIFFLEGNANVRQYNWNGNGWATYSFPGGIYSSDIAAVSWGSSRIDWFALGTDSLMYWRNYNGLNWNVGPAISSIQFTSAPTATTGGLGYLSVFAINTVGEVSWATYDSATLGWSSFTSVGSNKFMA